MTAFPDEKKFLALLFEVARNLRSKLGLDELEISTGLGESAFARGWAGGLSRLSSGHMAEANVRVWVRGLCANASMTLGRPLVGGLPDQLLALAAEARDVAIQAGQPYPLRPADPWVPSGGAASRAPDPGPVEPGGHAARRMATDLALNLYQTARRSEGRVLECQSEARRETLFVVNTLGLALSRTMATVKLMCHLAGETRRTGVGAARGSWTSPPDVASVVAAARAASRDFGDLRMAYRQRKVVLSRETAAVLVLGVARHLGLGAVPALPASAHEAMLELTDDPGQDSADGQPWDAEGSPTTTTVLLREGRQSGYLRDLASFDAWVARRGPGKEARIDLPRGGNARRESVKDPLRVGPTTLILGAPPATLSGEVLFVDAIPGLATAISSSVRRTVQSSPPGSGARFALPATVHVGAPDGPLARDAVISCSVEELWARIRGGVGQPALVTVPGCVLTPELLVDDVMVGSA